MNNITIASAQWATRPEDQRFETLTALHDKVHGRRMKSRSADVDFDRVEAYVYDGQLLINSAIEPCEPSNWGFSQLASGVGAPVGYLRTLPPPMVADLLNHGIKNTKRQTVKFMTVASDTPEAPNTLQAVTSTTYGRIWDADVVDKVVNVVDRTGGVFKNPPAYDPLNIGGPPKPSGLYASDHDVFMFLIDGGSLLDGGDRAQLHRGFIAWNSEVGARQFGLMTFLFNCVCGNHIIWGAQDVNTLLIRHSKGGPARFDAQAIPLLNQYVNAEAAPLMAVVEKAQGYLLPSPEGKTSAALLESVLEFCHKHSRAVKFTRGELDNAVWTASREEGDCRTLWQLVQGLTAYARGFEYIDARVDLEKRAGKLLDIVAA